MLHDSASHARSRGHAVVPLARARTRRPRIMQVVVSLAPGGTEHLVIEICKRLQSDFEITVCCLDEPGLWARDLQSHGLEVVALRRRPGFRPHLGRRIAAIAAERRATLLHCHQYSPFVYGRLAAWCHRGLKLVYTEHGRQSDAAPPWKQRIVNPILARFDGEIVAVSAELRRYMIDARFPAARVAVIHNGIDIGGPPSPFDRHRARRQLGIRGDDFVIATVARLDPVKDLGLLLNAAAVVRTELPHMRLVIIGDGPERDALLERANRRDLAGAVHLTGYRSDVRALMPAADVYVNTSVTEGISLTILEAMASSVPVVATSVGGTPEILSHGTTGVLVPPKDPTALASGILSLATDSARRKGVAAAARRHVEDAFTIERMVDAYADTYRRLLD